MAPTSDTMVQKSSINKDVLVGIVQQFRQYMDHSPSFEFILQKFQEVLTRQTSEKYPIVEVGTRLGGSALSFMKLLVLNERKNLFYTVDPYGDMPLYSDGGDYIKSPYDNKMFEQAMKNLSEFTSKNPIKHKHFKCTSQKFTTTISAFDEFLFVFLDGDHHIDTVKMELNFFLPRLAPKGCVIVDDARHRKKMIIDVINDISKRTLRTYKISDISSFERCIIEEEEEE